MLDWGTLGIVSKEVNVYLYNVTEYVKKIPLTHHQQNAKKGKQVGFIFRRNWSGPTDGLRRLSASEFQTVGPAEAKERQPKVLQRTRGTVS